MVQLQQDTVTWCSSTRWWEGKTLFLLQQVQLCAQEAVQPAKQASTCMPDQHPQVLAQAHIDGTPLRG